MTRFAYIINSITPYQTENEMDFSLAGIYTASYRAKIYVEMLPDLIFINRNSTSLGRNTPIDVFGRSLDAMDNIVDDADIKPDTFTDAIDTE